MRRRIISIPILRLFLLLSPIVLVLPIRRTRCRPRVSLCSLMVSVDTVSMSGRRRVLEGGIRREVGRLAEVLEFRRPYLHLGILDLDLVRRAGGKWMRLWVGVRVEVVLLLDVFDVLPL